MSILAIDAGTTGVTALVVSTDAAVISRGYAEFAQHFPQEGWVEHDPNEIWAATLAAVRDALAALEPDADRPTAIGITKPARDRRALGPRDPRRPAARDRLAGPAYGGALRPGPRRRARTARRRAHRLRLDPYFSATKLTWIKNNEPHVWAQVVSGRVAIGTVDSYLVARLTRGLHHVHGRLERLAHPALRHPRRRLEQELCDIFGVPMARTARGRAVLRRGRQHRPVGVPRLDLPIAGIAGDQQAALFGQACFRARSSKCTYGTGSFVLVNTGDHPVTSSTGLLTTVAWQHPDGRSRTPSRARSSSPARPSSGCATAWASSGARRDPRPSRRRCRTPAAWSSSRH